MNTEQEIGKVTHIVLNLLRYNERCRNDDKYLTYLVMRKFTNIYIPFEDFSKLPAFETIKRVRAKIQNVDKLYLPTNEDVILRRRNRQHNFKRYIKVAASTFNDNNSLLKYV